MRGRETLLVAVRELREASRSRWFVLAATSFLALSLALAFLGLAGSMRSGLAGYDRTTASVLNLALLFVPLVSLLLGGLGVAGELEDGSLALLLSQPLTRGEAYLGKFLGLLAAVWGAVCVGFGATGILVGALAGGDAGPFAALVGLVLLLSCATLAIGTCLSVLLRRRSRVVGASFAVWLGLAYLSDLGTIGFVIAQRLSPGQTFLLAMLNPVEQARVLGTLALARRIDVLGPAGVYALDHLGTGGVVAVLVAALVVSSAVPLLCGWAAFRRLAVT